jgi:hypothetical protein
MSDAQVERAARILLIADDGAVKVSEAMRMAGYSVTQRMDQTAQQQVRRVCKMLQAAAKPPPKPPPRPPATSSFVSETTRALICSSRWRNKILKHTKQLRLTSNQAAAVRKEKAEDTLHRNACFKQATQNWKAESQKPKGERKSAEKIVEEINEKENVNIVAKTVRKYVKNGLVSATPEKRGEKGTRERRRRWAKILM